MSTCPLVPDATAIDPADSDSAICEVGGSVRLSQAINPPAPSAQDSFSRRCARHARGATRAKPPVMACSDETNRRLTLISFLDVIGQATGRRSHPRSRPTSYDRCALRSGNRPAGCPGRATAPANGWHWRRSGRRSRSPSAKTCRYTRSPRGLYTEDRTYCRRIARSTVPRGERNAIRDRKRRRGAKASERAAEAQILEPADRQAPEPAVQRVDRLAELHPRRQPAR